MEKKYWAEKPLADHPKLKQFNRSLALSGFNFPDVGDLIYLTFKVIFRDKETGETFKEVTAAIFTIPMISPGPNLNKKFGEFLDAFLTEKENDINNLT